MRSSPELRSTRRVATGMAIVALAASAAPVEASNGGGTAAPGNEVVAHQNARHAAKHVSKRPCPTPERMAKRSFMSKNCQGFLVQSLRHAGYGDYSSTLAIATYQKVAELGVDGTIGTKETGPSILRGRALKVTSPDSHSRAKHELFIDKSQQVAYDLARGHVKHIFSVSTGTERHFHETDSHGKVHDGVAHTPTGHFKIHTTAGANYVAAGGLGPMPYAKFFDTMNYAVHSGNVDLDGRDSHGCARIDPDTMSHTLTQEYGNGDSVTIVE